MLIFFICHVESEIITWFILHFEMDILLMHGFVTSCIAHWKILIPQVMLQIFQMLSYLVTHIRVTLGIITKSLFTQVLKFILFSTAIVCGPISAFSNLHKYQIYLVLVLISYFIIMLSIFKFLYCMSSVFFILFVGDSSGNMGTWLLIYCLNIPIYCTLGLHYVSYFRLKKVYFCFLLSLLPLGDFQIEWGQHHLYFIILMPAVPIFFLKFFAIKQK